MILVQAVGYLNLEFPFTDPIVKYDDDSVVLDGRIVDFPVFQDDLP